MAYTDPEKKRAADKAYYWAHREEKLASLMVYRSTHREEARACTAAWRARPENQRRLQKQRDRLTRRRAERRIERLEQEAEAWPT